MDRESLQVSCENFGNLIFLCVTGRFNSFILKRIFLEPTVVYTKSEANVTRATLTMLLLFRSATVDLHPNRAVR